MSIIIAIIEMSAEHHVFELDDMTNYSLLHGADIYYTNESKATSSLHIIVTISKMLTGAEAMILFRLVLL